MFVVPVLSVLPNVVPLSFSVVTVESPALSVILSFSTTREAVPTDSVIFLPSSALISTPSWETFTSLLPTLLVTDSVPSLVTFFAVLVMVPSFAVLVIPVEFISDFVCLPSCPITDSAIRFPSCLV